METVIDSNKETEKVTMGKLDGLALKVVDVENDLTRIINHVGEVRNPENWRLERILFDKAEIKKLEREVDEVIRNHAISCPCGCSVNVKLRELNYFEHNEGKFFVRDCDNPVCEWGTPLAGESLAFVEKLLQYSSVRAQDLFDK